MSAGHWFFLGSARRVNWRRCFNCLASCSALFGLCLKDELSSFRILNLLYSRTETEIPCFLSCSNDVKKFNHKHPTGGRIAAEIAVSTEI